MNLKPFQRATVQRAVAALTDPVGSRRFLVADEVGLGKTLVAQGVIEALREQEGRQLRVFYVCSSLTIAHQNRDNILRCLSESLRKEAAVEVDRLTLIPTARVSERAPFLFYTLTPGTLPGSRRTGRVEERAFIWELLCSALSGLARCSTVEEALRNGVGAWDQHREDAAKLVQQADQRFARAVKRTLALRFDLAEGAHTSTLILRVRRWVQTEEGRKDLVHACRMALATAALELLAPDLVIFDEFQRFFEMLPGTTDEEDEDARKLMRLMTEGRREAGHKGAGPGVLLLSATPYPSFTTWEEGGKDHHENFYRLLGFLFGNGAHNELGPLKSDFREYRDLLATERLGGRKAFAARDSIRDRMLRVMSRTERPREAGGSLSLSIRRSAVPLEPIDIRVFKHLRESADDRDVGSVPAYWASIPYALQMMDERYVLAERASPKPLNGTSRLTCINEGVVRDFGEVPVPHPRLRGLLQEIPPELLALPWLPPTRPWWKLGGPFAEALERLGTHPSSKALVFSRYRAVPRALACAASYAAERHCFAEEAQRKRAGAAVAYEYRLEQGERPRAGRRRRPRPTFIFPKSSKHEMGLRTLLMFIPLPVLAKLGDPLPLAARSNGELTHDNALSSSMQKLRDRLGPPSRRREPVAAYRWAARLERTGDHWETYSQALMALATEASARSSSDQTTSGLLQAIRDFLSADDIAGGPTERELRDLAEFAISSPGNVLLRSTDRVFGEPLHEDERFRVIAEVSVYGLRPYLDASDLHLLLWRNRRAQHPASVRQAVWDGNLESALDEYLALQRGLGTDPKLSDLRLLETRALETLGEALNLGAVTLRVKDGDTTSGSKFGIRCHAALPFGMSQEIVSGDGVLRNDTLRKSFNSPFRPHLLVTTSIGQEGLDFHAYCNHVVHWDLPSNPVDLEQRDGRVNRYAGLAQRRALAQDSYALPSHKSPWIAIADAQREDATGMSPWWTHPGAGIRRTMFTPPFSRIEPELERLLRSLSLYRMALGQSDQEALVSALHRRLSEPGVDREALMKWLEKARIDLSPKA